MFGVGLSSSHRIPINSPPCSPRHDQQTQEREPVETGNPRPRPSLPGSSHPKPRGKLGHSILRLKKEGAE
ncbi:hypothetical protein E2C01_098294 [Portunus trituberculatus]|uniref:Uncharacterized protein n=1 Tax=Portunus trituberculatus TaxID=210409 RepID=A0A5B7KBR8_PORTR|nr:hypothetical protein [Portunus trituberculatus]